MEPGFPPTDNSPHPLSTAFGGQSKFGTANDKERVVGVLWFHKLRFEAEAITLMPGQRCNTTNRQITQIKP